MIVTNKLNLPETLVKAVSTERHNKEHCYSATTLLKGVSETILSKRYFDKIEDDASESIWQIFGTAVHSIFENQNDETFKEERFSVQLSHSTVTGQVDCYDLENEVIVDWKTASVWKVQFKDFDDWRKQGMIYAWLMKKNGLEVKKCRFIALLKDHSKSKARFDSQYPQSPVFVYEFDVTDGELAMCEKFIIDRITELENAENLKDEELPICSAEERWASEDKFAVMKEGRKTAVKLFNDEESAKNFIDEQKDKKLYIEYRKGESRKCLDYCSCAKFCPFYKSINAVGD